VLNFNKRLLFVNNFNFSKGSKHYNSVGKLCPGNNTCNENGDCNSTNGLCACYDEYYGEGCESKY